MKYKNILLLLLLLSGVGTAFAQTQEATGQLNFQPFKGDIQVGLTLGSSQSYDGSWYMNAPKAGDTEYGIKSPSLLNNPLERSSLDMFGVDVKYFITSDIAIRFSGAGFYDASPAYEGIPGVIDESEEDTPFTQLPTYEEVPSLTDMEFAFKLGADKYFTTGVDRLCPYIGAVVNVQYAKNSTFNVGGEKLDPAEESPYLEVVRQSEAYGIGGSCMAGVEYYVAQGVYCGFEFSPVAYMYTVNRQLPEEGLEAIQADNHNVAIFSQLTFRMGVRF